MKKKYFFIFLLVIINYSYPQTNFWENMPKDRLIDTLVEQMNDEELIGQQFFLGYWGKTPSSYIKNWISGRNIGGVKIFSRNIENIPSLAKNIHDMQTLASETQLCIPLFIATDQEGGWVRHIYQDVLVVPGNLSLGASPVINDAFTTGYHIGIELALIGINMNFAPTVDIYSNPLNTGIGPRSFSSDPVKTGILAAAYFKGMGKAGVLCTAKHFPGHGGCEEDSHGYLPAVNAELDVMREREFVPYRFLIKEGIPAIMSGHLAFPKVIGDNTPASVSHFFLTHVLREELSFKNIVLTDDLEMYGAHQGETDIPHVCEKAIKAGNDMILISHSPDIQEASWQKLKSLMKTDKSFKEIVKESVRRILKVKINAFKGDKPCPVFPDYKNVLESIKTLQEKESKEAIFQTACRSVTVIGDEMIPYRPEKNEKIILIGQYRQFIEEGLKRYPDARYYEYSYYPEGWSQTSERNNIGNLVQNNDTIIFLIVNFNSYEILKSIKKYNKSVIVISSLTPVYLNDFPWIGTQIAVYGTGVDSFKAAFAVLKGDFKAEGKLPLKFD